MNHIPSLENSSSVILTPRVRMSVPYRHSDSSDSTQRPVREYESDNFGQFGQFGQASQSLRDARLLLVICSRTIDPGRGVPSAEVRS